MILGSPCLDFDIESVIGRLRVQLKWKMVLKLL